MEVEEIEEVFSLCATVLCERQLLVCPLSARAFILMKEEESEWRPDRVKSKRRRRGGG